MQSLVDVVAAIEVTAEHSAEVLPDQVLEHFSCPRVMVLIIADAGSGDAPNVAVASIFTPSCFIGLDRRTRSDCAFEGLQSGLHMLLDPVEQFDNLSDTHLEPMHSE